MTLSLCMDQSQADRRLKKSKPSYQRTNSQTFKMFDEAQIKEFKEIFGFLDQDGNGVIEVDDLVALHGIMGKPADDSMQSDKVIDLNNPVSILIEESEDLLELLDLSLIEHLEGLGVGALVRRFGLFKSSVCLRLYL